MMPNMDGFRLKEKINEIKQARNIPFIFLTARSLEEDKLMGLRLGVDDYVTKPFNREEYKARIYNLLKNYKVRMDGQSEDPVYTHTESVDIQKLKEAERIVLINISNPDFKVTDLADELHYSQRQLARVIQQLTGLTPVGFILELRLQRAYHLIKSKSYSSLSEVRDEISIESSSYFSRKFKERFGVSPSEI
jgi:YesN/AraC family two-component response regulator